MNLKFIVSVNNAFFVNSIRICEVNNMASTTNMPILFCNEHPIFFPEKGVHSMQGLRDTTRHGVKRKRRIKGLKAYGKAF